MYASFNGKRVTVFNDNGSPHTNIRTRHPAVQVSVSGSTVVAVNEKGDTEIFGAKFYMLDLLHHYGVKARIMNAGPGVRAKACCPFHNEQTPGFEVDLINGKYHCFGCGASGNAIDLVMAKEGLSRGAAIDWLVKRYGAEVASYISGLQKWMIELHGLGFVAANLERNWLNVQGYTQSFC